MRTHVTGLIARSAGVKSARCPRLAKADPSSFPADPSSKCEFQPVESDPRGSACTVSKVRRVSLLHNKQLRHEHVFVVVNRFLTNKNRNWTLATGYRCVKNGINTKLFLYVMCARSSVCASFYFASQATGSRERCSNGLI